MALIASGMPNVTIVDICQSSGIVDGDGMRGDREALHGLLHAPGASQTADPTAHPCSQSIHCKRT
jgi:hypothetical protein